MLAITDRAVLFAVVRRGLPRVHEDENVVGSDAEDDEDREDVERAEELLHEDVAVEEVRCRPKKGVLGILGFFRDVQCSGIGKAVPVRTVLKRAFQGRRCLGQVVMAKVVMAKVVMAQLVMTQVNGPKSSCTKAWR